MMNEPTRSFPAESDRPADTPTHTHTPPEPPPADGATADFDPSATPPHLAGFAAQLGALASPDSTRDAIPHPTTVPVPQVPGYELLDELGRGGMGVVYKARELKLNRTVALKMVLAGPYADPATRVRFLLEAESVAAVQHPHIVQVFAFGEHAGHPYLAMEYLGGGTLADKVRAGGPLPPLEAARLAATLAEAMAAAHAAGIVHRDLKPANVLLSATGEPKVTDFGLAKVGRSDMTATGAVLGTPSYMAPEQAAGKTREVGTAADVYGLGAILYDVLTGRPPFRGDSQAATIQMVLTAEPARPRSVNAGIPRDLETICLKCLEKVPVRRYATAAALAEDLQRFLNHEPVSARPVGQAGRAWRWCRRNPAVAGLLAAVLLVFAAGAGVAGYFAVEESNRAKEANDNAKRASDREKEANDERNKVLAEQQRVLEEQRNLRAEQDRTRRLVHLNQMNNASFALRGGRFDQLARWLDTAKPNPGEPDVRGWEWHYLDRLTRSESHSFAVPPPGFDPAVVGRSEPPLLDSSSLTPDGRRLVLRRFEDAGEVLDVWDVPTGRRVAEIRVSVPRDRQDRDQWALPPAISPDGTRVVYAVRARPAPKDAAHAIPRRMGIWDVASGEEILGPRGDSVVWSPPVVGPAAGWVAWVEAIDIPEDNPGKNKGSWPPRTDFAVLRWDHVSGQTARHPLAYEAADAPGSWTAGCGLTPDGRSLAVYRTRDQKDPRGAYDERVEVWDATGSPLRLRWQSAWVRTPPDRQRGLMSSWSPTGRALLLGTLTQFAVHRTDDGTLIWGADLPPEYLSLRDEFDGVTVSDDGTRAVMRAKDHTLFIIDRKGEGASALAGVTPLFSRGAVGPYLQLTADGKSLITPGADGRSIRRWDLTRNLNQVVRWESTEQRARCVVSPDYRLAAEYRPLTSVPANPNDTAWTLVVRDLSTGKDIGQVEPPEGYRVHFYRPLSGFYRPVSNMDCSFSPDGRRLLVRYQRAAATAPAAARVVVYDTEGLRPVARWDSTTRPMSIWTGPWVVENLIGSPSVVRDSRTGEVVPAFPRPTTAGRSLIPDPSGERLAETTGVSPNTFRGPGGGGFPGPTGGPGVVLPGSTAGPESMWNTLVKLSGGTDTIKFDNIPPETKALMRLTAERRGQPVLPDTGEWTKAQFMEYWERSSKALKERGEPFPPSEASPVKDAEVKNPPTKQLLAAPSQPAEGKREIAPSPRPLPEQSPVVKAPPVKESPPSPWPPSDPSRPAVAPLPREIAMLGVRVCEARTGRVIWARPDIARVASLTGPRPGGPPGSWGGPQPIPTASDPVFSPDGRWLAVSYPADGASKVWVGRAADGVDVRTLEVRGDPESLPVSGLWFSPDGRRLAVARGPEILVWDVESGERLWRFPAEEAGVDWAAFTSDGSRLLTVSGRGLPAGGRRSLVVWDLATGRELISVPLPEEQVATGVGGRSAGRNWQLSPLIGDRFFLRSDAGVWVFDGTPVKE